MRRLIIALLWLACSAQASPPFQILRSIDLDVPGALDQLKRERPTHYAQVIAEMDKIQAVPREETFAPSQPLFYDPSVPDPTRRHIQTSDPAKTSATLTIESVVYSFTVLYTKDRPTTVPAK